MLRAILGIVLAGLWLGWLTYWWASARNVKVTRWREPLALQLFHRVPLICAALLLAAPRWVPKALTRRFIPLGLFSVLGLVLVAAGLGFAIWARRHLGRNWSAHVAVKEDHALVRTGPYRHVRHPIYAGILLAFLGTALVVGEWRGLVAVPFALLAFAVKSRMEERQMRQVFPEYEQYARETASIIPYVY